MGPITSRPYYHHKRPSVANFRTANTLPYNHYCSEVEILDQFVAVVDMDMAFHPAHWKFEPTYGRAEV